MSNVIKSLQQIEQEQKLILNTRPVQGIVKKEPSITDEESQSEEIHNSLLELEKQRNYLTEEIESLQQSFISLQNHLEEEKARVSKEIEEWWIEKQQENAQEAERVALEAEQRGFAEGYEKGFRQVQEEFKQHQEEIQQTITLAYEEKARIIKEAEPFLLDLSVKIAEKIVSDELKQHPEQVIQMVKAGLQQVIDREEITLFVSTTDYALVAPYIQELQQLVAPGSELKVIPDYSYTGIGCMIQTPNGSYDVTLDSQLQEIKKQLLNLWEERADE